MSAQTIELFGYAASFFVAVSLIMVSLLRLRILNLIGCTFFVVYGALIGSFPIVLTNSFIMAVNVYFLIQMYRKDISSFEYVDARDNIDELMNFIDVKATDIQKYYPDFHECHIRAASAGRGRVYQARKGGRIQGFAFALYDESLELSRFCGDNNALRSALQEILESDYQGQPVFFVDYIVDKYRDLGLAGKFHEQLIADLSAEYDEFLWVNHRSNRRMHRLLSSLGYKEYLSSGDYEVLKLTLQKKVTLPA
jgi:hypothetical protein